MNIQGAKKRVSIGRATVCIKRSGNLELEFMASTILHPMFGNLVAGARSRLRLSPPRVPEGRVIHEATVHETDCAPCCCCHFAATSFRSRKLRPHTLSPWAAHPSAQGPLVVYDGNEVVSHHTRGSRIVSIVLEYSTGS